MKTDVTTRDALPSQERERLLRQWKPPRFKQGLGLGLAAVILVWSALGAEFRFDRLATGAVNMAEYLGRLFPPSFEKFDVIVALLIETLQMAILGTVLGAAMSMVIAFGAAANIAPRWLYSCCRVVLNVLRSIPDLVLALMFVSAVGLGPFAGVLAMAFGSVGTIGKMYAETMEAVDDGPVMALQSVGATQRQVITYAIVPQAAPGILSYTLLLFEGNVRGATILGLVGAGGIGLELTQAMRTYDYSHMSAIILCIIVTVTVIDRLSALVRRKALA